VGCIIFAYRGRQASSCAYDCRGGFAFAASIGVTEIDSLSLCLLQLALPSPTTRLLLSRPTGILRPVEISNVHDSLRDNDLGVGLQIVTSLEPSRVPEHLGESSRAPD
jgi:hypothetical protein